MTPKKQGDIDDDLPEPPPGDSGLECFVVFVVVAMLLGPLLVSVFAPLFE